MSTMVPPPAPTPPPAAGIRRDPALRVVIGLIAVLVAVALVVVFTRGQPVPLDADTPGGVVQAYTTAVLDGDEATAARYLTDEFLADCDGTGSPATDDIRVSLLDTIERDSSADVRVLIVTSDGGGPFGSSEYETEDVFDLVTVDGEWLIEQAPWQLSVCPSTTRGDTP